MALSKVTYVDNETVIGAKNLNDIQDEIIRLNTAKQDTLQIDETPTEDSTNPVQSGGVYSSLADLTPDKTLTEYNKPAEARTTGKELKRVENEARFGATTGLMVDPETIVWQQGTINHQTGAEGDNPWSIRTGYIPVANIARITCDSDHIFMLLFYSAQNEESYEGYLNKNTGTITKESTVQEITSTDLAIGNVSRSWYVRIRLSNSNQTTITPSSEFTLTIYDGTDTTLSNKGVSADAKATGDRATVIKEIVNAAHSYVNYGYDTPYVQDEASSGYWYEKIGINRLENRIILNKQTDMGYPTYTARIKVSGDIAQSINNAGVEAWTTGISLKADHVYAARVDLVGGTSTYKPSGEDPQQIPPTVHVYETGTSTNVATLEERSDGSVTRTFTAQQGKSYNLAITYKPGNWTFTNAVLIVTLEDCTESAAYQEKQRLNTVSGRVDGLTDRVGVYEDISDRFAFTDGQRINRVNGKLNEVVGTSASDYVDISAFSSIRIAAVTLTAGGGYTNNHASGYAFYSDTNEDSFVSGTKDPFDETEETSAPPIWKVVNVPSTAKYIRVTWYKSDSGYYSQFSCDGTKKGSLDVDDSLPQYYFDNNYLPGRISTILSTIASDDDLNTDNFLFFTDPHFWRVTTSTVENGMNGEKLIKYVQKNTNIRMIVCAGDLSSGNTMTQEQCTKLLSAYRAYMAPVWQNLYTIIGNHDWNNPSDDDSQTANMLNAQQIYAQLIKDKESQYGAVSAYGDYWLDNALRKVRYFFVGMNYKAQIETGQQKWLAEQLLSVPAGYTVVVLMHGSVSSDGSYYIGFAEVAATLDAAKSRGSYTIDGTTYNYSGTNFEIACVISGHLHMDKSTATSGGIPIIIVCADKYGTSSDTAAYRAAYYEARKIGTITEQVLDVVHLDMTAKTVTMMRVGGSITGVDGPFENPDRVFSYGE